MRMHCTAKQNFTLWKLLILQNVFSIQIGQKPHFENFNAPLMYLELLLFWLCQIIFQSVKEISLQGKEADTFLEEGQNIMMQTSNNIHY